ncbi:MAG TPA: carboxypeptidase-like regulatory domain-containing protein [Pyrinomonadaceae bacterium]|jgi:hypothetical protein
MPGSISGQVTLANGTGQSGVTVQATGVGKPAKATTNSQGNYLITNLSAGTYTVSVVPGAGTYTPPFNAVALGQNTNATFINFSKMGGAGGAKKSAAK